MPPERERIRVVHPEEEPRERKSRFGLAFAIYAIVLLLVLAAGCVVLWFYLDAYEATLPGHVMDEFTELADEAYWSDALEGAFTVGETPFEDRDELLEELCMSVLRSNPLEYREDEGYSADNMVYLPRLRRRQGRLPRHGRRGDGERQRRLRLHLPRRHARRVARELHRARAV